MCFWAWDLLDFGISFYQGCSQNICSVGMDAAKALLQISVKCEEGKGKVCLQNIGQHVML